MKQLRIVGIVALLLVLVLTGCQLAPPAAPAPAGAGVLNLAGPDPITLDPAVSGEMTSHEYIVQIFGGLVRLDDNLSVVADIAERWTISPDGRAYTFNLRHDAKFHSGRDVKAPDFKYAWERACSPATGSKTASSYPGDIVGVKDVVTGKAKEISGLRVLDDYTLQVAVDGAKSYFLYKLSYPTAFVVDKANVDQGKDWWRKPNGTGPFKLRQWQPGQTLTLDRNDQYYGDKAKVSSVVFQILSGITMNLYETGKIDAASVGLGDIDRAADRTGPFYTQLNVSPELSFTYIGFNAAREPFNDADVRRAFVQAVDKRKLVSLVNRDMVQMAKGILPPGMPGYNPDLVGLDFSPDQAKASLAKSKYHDAAGLPQITLTTSGWGGQISNIIEALVQEWRQNLGVEVRVRQIEPERFLYYLRDDKNEMFDMGWVADYPHPQDFLDILFHTGSDNNYGGYSNPAVDTLLNQAALAGDSLNLYRQAEQKLVDDAACLPLSFGKNYTLVRPYVTGYKLNPLGFVALNKVSVGKK